MSEQRDWSDYAVQDWIRMQHYERIADAQMDEDICRVIDEQIKQSERSAALESAFKAWRME